jgi:thiol-disulfide isomerase/thioredoxin
LADFKGKYVYIDLWATWCNPCRKEFPFLKELEQKFEGAAITFLGLSVDGSREKWESMVRSGALSGVQLYLGPRTEFQKSYNIEGIPRFILLDRDGVIINPEMTRPSSDDTAAYLESLEGIR